MNKKTNHFDTTLPKKKILANLYLFLMFSFYSLNAMSSPIWDCYTKQTNNTYYCTNLDKAVIRSLLRQENTRVVLGNGTYFMNTVWLIATGSTLEGESRDGVILKKNTDWSDDREHQLAATGKDRAGITINNLTIDGNRAHFSDNNECNRGIHLSRCKKCTVKNVRIARTASDGIRVDLSSQITLSNNWIYDTGTHACNPNEKNHYGRQGGGHAISLSEVDSFNVEHNQINGTFGGGINVSRSKSTDSSRGKVRFNKIMNQDTNAVENYAGIRVSNGSVNVDIEGNEIKNYRRGLHISSGSQEVYAGNNTFANNSTNLEVVLVQGQCNIVFCNSIHDTDDDEMAQLTVTDAGIDGSNNDYPDLFTITRHNLIKGNPTAHYCGGHFISNVCDSLGNSIHKYNSTSSTVWDEKSSKYCSGHWRGKVYGLRQLRNKVSPRQSCLQ